MLLFVSSTPLWHSNGGLMENFMAANKVLKEAHDGCLGFSDEIWASNELMCLS
jgi:hypothetical protein